MRIDELTVEVRDASLERVGQILPKDLVGFKAVMRFNNVGSWEISLPNGHEVGEILRLPGSGIVVTGPNGVLISGPTTGATNTKTADNPNGDWLIQGVDDSVVLGERLAYPDPSNADVTNQAATHDTRLGLASTAMYGYVNANIGPLAPVEREIPGLTMAVDAGLGSYVYPSARFDILGELLSGIAAIDGLGFDIKQVDGALEFRVFEPTNRSGYIRMDVANNTLSKTEYAYGSHALSRAIVAGGGEGLNRTFIEVTSTESLSAETTWGRRIETFLDQRNTTDVNELTQAGNEKLAEGGATLTSVDVIPSSDLTMAYGSDWDLGDVVTVVVDEQEVAATVTTVSLSIGSDGVRVGATVGQPTGVDFESVTARKSTQTAQRVNALERKEAPAIVWNDEAGTYEFVLKGGNVTLQIGQEQNVRVKNDTGATLTNGTVVYPTGSDGVNKTVAKAQANSEATSTQTFGVLTEDIANGQKGFVTTFGLVHDLDTSALTEGQAVWLSPDVAGGLTSVKPSARTRTNLAINPSFELNTNGWIAGGTTISRDTVTYYSGTASIKVVAAGQYADLRTDNISVSPNTKYTVSYWVKGEASKALDTEIYQNSGGTQYGVAYNATGGWQYKSFTFTTSPTASTMQFVVKNYYAGAHTFYVDNVLIEQTDRLQPYFDGSTTTYTGATCSWTSGAHSSPSIAKVNEHMVLVGFCVRSHANNGVLFVKVQNGFELNELHDVAISNVAAGELMVRDSSNTRWENQTLAEANISAIGHTHDAGNIISGTLATARIPNLDASIITSGTLNVARHDIDGIFNNSGKTYGAYTDFNSVVTHGTFHILGTTNGPGHPGALEYYGWTQGLGTNYAFQYGAQYAMPRNVANPALYVRYREGSTWGIWRVVSAGLAPIRPSSVGISAGSSTISDNGLVTFSGTNTVRLNGVFTSQFTNYRLVYRGVMTGNNGIAFQFAANGSSQAFNGYSSSVAYWGSRGNGAGSVATQTYIGYIFGHNRHSFSCDILSPQLAGTRTHLIGSGTASADSDGAGEIHFDGGTYKYDDQFDGISMFTNGTFQSGTVQIFGYTK